MKTCGLDISKATWWIVIKLNGQELLAHGRRHTERRFAPSSRPQWGPGAAPSGGRNSHFTSKQVKMEYLIRWGFMLAQQPFLCGKKIFSFCVIWPLKTFVKLWLLSSANQVKIVKICSKQTFLCILACDIYNISLLSHCFTKIGYGQRTCDISISLMPHCLLLSCRGMCIQ